MDLDFNTGEEKRKKAVEALADIIDLGILEKQGQQKPRDYLGGSYIGDNCERKIQYTYRNAVKDEDRGFTPKTYRIFDMGHTGEDLVARYINDAGFILSVDKGDGYQHGFSRVHGRFKGHVDGVIKGYRGSGESPIVMPCLWENKMLGEKSFKDLQSRGLERSKPIYYAQIIIYMFEMTLTQNPALFSAVNRNTGDIYFELVKFNAKECQRLQDRVARVLQASDADEILPRVTDDQNSFYCRFCDYQSTCWG